MRLTRIFAALWMAGLALGASTAAAGAQEVPGEAGVVAAGLLIRQLDGVKRVLMIGAHPDDEDTSLLAELARGWGARTAYLALTRGDGGQNLIGKELAEGLGLLRTGELLSARRLDGAEQYFSRAFDFGYSKTARETFRHWPRDSLLADVVRVIRSFRPQVIVSIFGGTPRDGHGQHQVAGLLARDAFDAAGDSTRFPNQIRKGLAPWTPLKLYRRTFRDPQAATLSIQTGARDPLLGRSHHQLAMAGRSRHRSQDFGVAQPAGAHFSRLRLLRTRVSAPPDASLFQGIDTTLSGMVPAEPVPASRRILSAIRRYREAVAEAALHLRALDPAAAAPALADALDALQVARRMTAGLGASGSGLQDALDRKAGLAREALFATAGLTLELRADDEVVVPGQTFHVEAEVWNGGPLRFRAEVPRLRAPDGWHVSQAIQTSKGPRSESEALLPGQLRKWRFEVTVGAAQPPSQPYFLRRPRHGDLYSWPDDPALRTRPLNPPLLSGWTALELEREREPPATASTSDGAQGRSSRPGHLSPPMRLSRPVRYRGVDKARGEFWRPLRVAPPVSVTLSPRILVWPDGASGWRTLSVTLRNMAPKAVSGGLRLKVPSGWRTEPTEVAFQLPETSATASFSFRLRASGGAGAAEGRIRAVARLSDGRAVDEDFQTVDYPHIEPISYVRQARARLLPLPVRVTRRRVGYIMGSGDQVPEAIRQLGLAVSIIEPDDLEAGVFDRFDVIVLGVRAYEVRPELRAANRRLLDWVRRGGTLVVQYNKYEFVQGGFAPYPLAIHRPQDRVTDETAKVTLLEPSSPVLTVPNRISGRDFSGWVQERGLYFPGEWDSHYTPLLSMADPGEKPRRGSLLIAPLGDGLYVYTALAFFRQLPAGVPGAYRLFANLLSLQPRQWRAYLAERGTRRDD
ncbi:MAG: PIG-L family deacetylase [Gemmatimonadota bacterium]